MNCKMRKIVVLFLFLSVSLYSQVDKKKQAVNLKLNNPFQTNSSIPSSSSLPSLEYKSVLDKEDNYLKKYSGLNKTKPTKSMLDQTTDFKNPGDEIRDKKNKELAKEGNREDVFFGKYKVNTPIIKIMTRDFAEPDGDKVQVILNDMVLVQSILLDVSFKSTFIDLREGDNLIDILALNQGLAGPNTATFAIYDGNGNLLTANDWNLNTGVSARFVIEYVKPIVEEKE